MKYLLLLFMISFLSKADGQDSQASVLQAVLTDSVVAKYISGYGDMDTSFLLLSGDKWKYSYHDGNVDYHSKSQMQNQPHSGIIQKIKVGTSKAVVKLYFRENNKFITKVKLERFYRNGPWHLKTRLIRPQLKDFNKQPRFFYFSFN